MKCFEIGGGRWAVSGGYWNCNGFAVSIVAVVTRGVDWSAYIGSTPAEGPAWCGAELLMMPSAPNVWWSEEDTMRFVAKHGAKISDGLARFIFAGYTFDHEPLVEMTYRR